MRQPNRKTIIHAVARFLCVSHREARDQIIDSTMSNATMLRNAKEIIQRQMTLFYPARMQHAGKTITNSNYVNYYLWKYLLLPKQLR